MEAGDKEQNITDDVGDTTEVLTKKASEELGQGRHRRVEMPPTSPLRGLDRQKRKTPNPAQKVRLEENCKFWK